jgi:hypothetical protein
MSSLIFYFYPSSKSRTFCTWQAKHPPMFEEESSSPWKLQPKRKHSLAHSSWHLGRSSSLSQGNLQNPPFFTLHFTNSLFGFQENPLKQNYFLNSKYLALLIFSFPKHKKIQTEISMCIREMETC